MDKIVNYNCDGMCVEAYCDKRYTRMHNMKLNGLEVVLGFCEKHAEEFEENEIADYIGKHKKIEKNEECTAKC